MILTNQPGADVLADRRARRSSSCTSSRRTRLPPREALKFFDWAYTKGDKMAEELDYVPMPDEVVGMVKKTWAADIKDASGKPIYTITQ